MNTSKPENQLVVGFIGILVVFAIAAACIAPFSPVTFGEWVSTAFMAATPAQIILGLLWHNSKPDFVNKLPQPQKGIMLTLITIITGAIVMAFLLFVVGQNHGITPMLVQYTIMSIVVIMWLVIIWECWPFKLLSNDPFKFGIYTLIGAYVIAYLVWTIFFDYSILEKIGHPHYVKELDPKGLFDMWNAATFAVTTAGLIIVHTLFEFWPINKISFGAPQPLRGMIATVYILVFSWLIRWFFVEVVGLAPVEYMVRVPVSLIFGTFLVNNMMQFSLFSNSIQPLRGLLLTVCASITAIAMYELYSLASFWHTGVELGMGPQHGFAKELWIASAMLGVTFPIVFLVSGFFNFWPFKSQDCNAQ